MLGGEWQPAFVREPLDLLPLDEGQFKFCLLWFRRKGASAVEIPITYQALAGNGERRCPWLHCGGCGWRYQDLNDAAHRRTLAAINLTHHLVIRPALAQ